RLACQTIRQIDEGWTTMQKAGAAGLIPRKKLFGNPTRAQAKISPDGQWLSWLAPKDGVLNICVAPAGDVDASRTITKDTKRGIRFHGWAYDSSHVLYMQDEGHRGMAHQ